MSPHYLYCERVTKVTRTIGVPALRPATAPSRRLSPRLQTTGQVWAFWHSQSHEDLSPVRDLSIGGLFLETHKKHAAWMLTRLHFLVEEGQIRADAEVRHVRPGEGMGLRFKAVNEKDHAKLAALLTRLRRSQHTAGRP